MIPLAIGTAQFGQKYGIYNKEGAVEGSAAQAIVDLAVSRGIVFFDTAQLYGESEAVLGSVLPTKNNVRVITKFAGNPSDPEKIRVDYEDSLKRLGREPYAVLIHNAQSLLTPNGDRIWDELNVLRNKKLVQRIGVSVYEPEELILIADRFGPDIVQVPCNILDQRFLAPEIQGLKKLKNIEIHARSVFLQGILINLPADIPRFMKDHSGIFEKIKKAADGAGMSMLEFCLSFASFCASRNMIDRWVVGVDAEQQLQSILECAENVRPANIEWLELATELMELIDPRRWNRSAT